jgi:hypothetical protein
MAIPVLIALVFLVAGVILVFHVQLLSGLRYMQPDSSDPRHVNYVLERNHQWFQGLRPNEGFWSPPFCYPWQNVGTQTDSMLGMQPFFSVWRIAGVLTETSYQLCSMSLLVGCFIAAWVFLRRGFSFGALAAAVGAFVFAFSSPRSAQIGHIMLFAHYATPLAVLGLVLEFRDSRLDPRRWQWIWLFFVGLVVQLYSSIYLTWFLLLLLILALAIALLLPPARSALIDSLRCKPKVWVAATAFAGLASLPLITPYLRASRVVPGSSFAEVFVLLPQPESFLFGGYGNWIGNFTGLNQWQPIATLQYIWEQGLSLGFVTTILALAGLWIQRRKPFTQVCVGAAAIALLLMMRWPGGFTLWKWVFEVLPGANAIRAVSRVALLLLLIASYGVASMFAFMTKKWGALPAAALALIVALEQGQTQMRYEKDEPRKRSMTIAQTVPEGCEVFFYTGLIEGRQEIVNSQLDAMWAGLITGIPTVNGYTSYQPPGWWEAVDGAMDFSPEPDALPNLAAGLSRAGANARSLCLVRIQFEGSHAVSSEVLSVPIS